MSNDEKIETTKKTIVAELNKATQAIQDRVRARMVRDAEEALAGVRNSSPPTPAATSATRPRGLGRIYKRGEVVWVEYWHRGQQHRESTGLTGRAGERAADKILKARWKQIGQGRFVGPTEDRVLITDLLDALKLDYELNGRRSAWTLAYRLTPLRSAFAGERATDVTEDRIARYTQARLAEGYASASVNRELAALRRAFRLGIRQKRLSMMPTITLLVEDNARQGFVEPATFEILAKSLPAPLDDVARFAYLTGWRKNEVITLAWTDVDRARGLIVLRKEHSKNNEPRVLPLTPTLAALIARRWQARTITRNEDTKLLAERVFHRGGSPVGSFRKAWASACKTAGVPGLLFHDLRRSAVRNFERAGVSQAVAMKVTGHKTASVYRRYRIVDERDIREALTKAEAAVAVDQARTVVPLTGRARKGSSGQSRTIPAQ